MTAEDQKLLFAALFENTYLAGKPALVNEYNDICDRVHDAIRAGPAPLFPPQHAATGSYACTGSISDGTAIDQNHAELNAW